MGHADNEELRDSLIGEPHHARSRFDCHLFGVPAVLEGAVA